MSLRLRQKSGPRRLRGDVTITHQDFADVNRRGGDVAFGEVAKQLRVLVTDSEGYLRGGFLFVSLLEG